MRIEEIFDERIKDIKNVEQTFDTAAIETMRIQKLQFSAIESQLKDGIERNNIDDINSSLFKLASFMQVDLGYDNQVDFVDKFDDMNISL